MGVKKLLALCRDLWSRMGEEREREKSFLENGSCVLEALIASCNGKPIPIRTFSYDELRWATNNYEQRHLLDYGSFQEYGCYYELYEGSFEGRTISIKTFMDPTLSELPITDLAISAKASAHKNVLKLVGCCLKTRLPTLVFESVENGTLAERIYAFDRDGAPRQRESMAWRSRLKVAREIAHAITYLHTGFSRPIIHRDIHADNIFFDQHDIPKLSGFSTSILIPEGETQVKDDAVWGTIGYACPTYCDTSCITEKTDVYSFGMLLLVLLTGQRACLRGTSDGPKSPNLINYVRERSEINQFVDPAILEGERGADEQQLQAVLQLAFICVDKDPETWPTMMDVTKELRRIGRSVC
ncbi:hypothetical protein CJ030_MR5G025017 [Morella rubra]|uniref:Protein kinase domain-containing protein n=1 Tax=Morella rubra TaxID=262757 RepID=A0A6A1VHB7_9ROSI|nr:hypothetical protein CJ030_MR5G025017 [Morella rubra]